jgi:hypothetical protein
MELIRVLTFFETHNANQQRWKRPFNQVAFFNYDQVNTVTVNDFIIPVAQVAPNGVIPGQFILTLNVGEINDSTFKISFVNGGISNYLVIVYTQYAPSNQLPATSDGFPNTIKT